MAVELVLGVIAMFFAIFVPGYFLTLAFFPRKTGLDGIERLTFSFVFSITFLPLLILVENQVFGVPIDFASVSLTMLVLIAFGIFGWAVRSQKLGVPAFLYAVLPKIQAEEAVPIIPKIRP